MKVDSNHLKEIKILNETIWENKANMSSIQNWIDGICTNETGDLRVIHENALYALEKFIYFNKRLVEIMLKSAYRDIYEYSLIEDIRRGNNDTLDIDFIEKKLKQEKNKTLFVGVGNASESGTHLLYTFRTINNLPRNNAASQSEVLISHDGKKLLNIADHITRLVLLDDFCGSGEQFSAYTDDFIENISKLKPELEVSYICLIGTSLGLKTVSNNVKRLSYVKSIFELDGSFKVLSDSSKYFSANMKLPKHFENVSRTNLRNLCVKFGVKNDLPTGMWTGYKDCELMIGFCHNTPDNTLPFFWLDDKSKILDAIFKRYHKNYG